MKKLLIVTALAGFAACNSNKEDAKVESMSSGTDTTQKVTYPYDITYSSKFEMGDVKNAQTILNLWKDWDNGTLANSRNSFADTIEMHFWNGGMMKNAKDSVIAAGQQMRDNSTTVVSRVDAVTALKSIDKDEDWALVWGMETDTDKKGKVDSFYLQETWRFNKAGKADLLYQFKASSMPPK